MRCPTCLGSGVRAVTQPAFVSSGLPFKVFLPDDEACLDCGGTGSLDTDTLADGRENEPEAGRREYIGTIVSSLSGKNAVNILLDGALHSGEKIVVMGEDGEKVIEVEWMQWGKAWIHLALRGWMVTIPTDEKLSAGARVYRVIR